MTGTIDIAESTFFPHLSKKKFASFHYNGLLPENLPESIIGLKGYLKALFGQKCRK